MEIYRREFLKGFFRIFRRIVQDFFEKIGRRIFQGSFRIFGGIPKGFFQDFSRDFQDF